MSKICPKCNCNKSIDDYYKLVDKRGNTSWCKSCLRERKRNKYKDNPKALEQVRIESYKRNYGITIDIYNKMLAKQNGGCAICGNPPAVGKHLDIDHSHKTGKVRGLLCHRCNMAIGMTGDNTNILRLAMSYLEKNEE